MSTSISLGLAISAGVAIGVLLESDVITPARWLAAASGLAAFLLAARGFWNGAKWLALGALSAACVIWGAHAEHQSMHPELRQVLDGRLGLFDIDTIDTQRHDIPIVIEGRLLSDAAPSESGTTLRMMVERAWIGECPESARGGVSLTVVGSLSAQAIPDWRAGRRIRARATLRRPARYLNYGVPDQERLLARRGIALVGTVKSAALVQLIDTGSWFDETAAGFRARVRAALEHHVGRHDPQSSAIAVAILIGDRGALDPDVEQRLQEAGTYHVIAISGGNIAILAGLILGSLWLIGIRDGWAAAAAVALLAGYAFMAGGGPSVMRATLMAAIYLMLRVIDQRTSPTHAMALSAAVILLVSPLSIADVGLWLTFGATAAIVIGGSKVRLPSQSWLRAPAALLLASVSAEVLLMPIGATIFQRITLAGLCANLVAVPCMAVAQIAAMATTMADALPTSAPAHLAGWLTHVSVRGLLASATIVDWAPWLTWRVPTPLTLVLLAYYLGAATWCIASTTLVRRVSITVVAALFIWMVTDPPTMSRRFGDGTLHVTMLDVGQGDAILVTLPNGRTLMVDTGGLSTGGGFDIGDRVIGPALRFRGIGRLDYLVITHADLDHIGGAMAVARDFAPSEIWYGTFVNNDEPTAKLRAATERKRAAWRWLLANDRIELGEVDLRVHHPPSPDWQRQRVRNDDSLVIEIRYRQVSILLTGDISADVERSLLASLDLLPTVVLKSPHHGSATSSSSEFIASIKPALVLISSGRGNPFGHPLPRVVERYRAIGAEVLRTDQVGQIELVIDGRTVTATTFTGAHLRSR